MLLCVDEIQNASTSGLSRLLTIVGDRFGATFEEIDVVGSPRTRHRPVVVHLAGLSDFRASVAQAGGTFACRFKTLELDYLDEVEHRAALVDLTTDGWEALTEDGAVDHIISAYRRPLPVPAGRRGRLAGRGRRPDHDPRVPLRRPPRRRGRPRPTDGPRSIEYDTWRPHGSLNGLTPAEYHQQWTQTQQVLS